MCTKSPKCWATIGSLKIFYRSPVSNFHYFTLIKIICKEKAVSELRRMVEWNQNLLLVSCFDENFTAIHNRLMSELLYFHDIFLCGIITCGTVVCIHGKRRRGAWITQLEIESARVAAARVQTQGFRWGCRHPFRPLLAVFAIHINRRHIKINKIKWINLSPYRLRRR